MGGGGGVDLLFFLEKFLDLYLIKNILVCICCKICFLMYGYYYFYNIKVFFYSLYKDIIN